MNMLWSYKSSILVIVLLLMYIGVTGQPSAAAQAAGTISYTRVIERIDDLLICSIFNPPYMKSL